jgi:cell division protein FtsI (penicillin-binding protein 3)
LLRLPEGPAGTPTIDPTIAHNLLRIMEESVQPGTGGRRAAVPGYRVAGKTGTVRKTSASGYEQDAYRSLFAGVAPVSDPRIVTIVMIDHPRAGDYFGGAVAAPVFSRVTGGALRLLDVPPDQHIR